ncbi:MULTISPECIES: hypothetical protein [unclassified Butyrivibrio]|uniref:hypothetical protein n=1 Tax=unclassified Butyrivibrio TaxID=2639466 RepID=UPI00047A6920|nr:MULTISPECIES: hypothetical protein [unclassified Butyrivibrio]
MEKNIDFTEGKIVAPLLKFAGPVLMALFLQGILGAFAIRVPFSFIMSKIEPVTLFRIGLATPCSTIVQIVLCFGYLMFMRRKKEL